jgi:hypothetical protein
MERQAVLASTGIPRMAQEVAVGHRVVARVAPKTAPADQDAPEFSAVRIADHEHIESVDEIAARRRRARRETRRIGFGRGNGHLVRSKVPAERIPPRPRCSLQDQVRSSDWWKRMASTSACPPATSAFPSTWYSRCL